MDRGQPSRRAARPPGRRGTVRRGRGAGLEPCAPRRRVRGPDLAVRVRRRRQAVHAPGDLPRGVRARRGPSARRRDRPRHGRPDDHRVRHRRAEVALPRQHPLGRGDLVPGLLGAGRGLGSRRGARERAAGGRPLRRRRPEGLVVVRAHRRLVHPPHPQRPRVRAARRPHLHGRRHALARCRGAAAAADHG